MAFIYAYSLADEEIVVKDFPLAASQGLVKGDMVILSGGNATAPAADQATVVGVYEGTNFQGLVASGQPYAPVTVTQNSQNNLLAKVRVVSSNTVFKVPYTGSAPTIGTAYGVTSGQAPKGTNAKINTANTSTAAIYQVVDVDTVNGYAFVIVKSTGRQLV